MIQQLFDLDDRFAVLESQARGENFNSLTRMKEDWLDWSNRFDKEGELVFGAFDGETLVGICGRNIDPYAGDSSVGRVRHLYVLPDYRRQGVGKKLVDRIVSDAHHYFSVLRLRAQDERAAKFYVALGFSSSSKEYETHVLKL